MGHIEEAPLRRGTEIRSAGWWVRSPLLPEGYQDSPAASKLTQTHCKRDDPRILCLPARNRNLLRSTEYKQSPDSRMPPGSYGATSLYINLLIYLLRRLRRPLYTLRPSTGSPARSHGVPVPQKKVFFTYGSLNASAPQKPCPPGHTVRKQHTRQKIHTHPHLVC